MLRGLFSFWRGGTTGVEPVGCSTADTFADGNGCYAAQLMRQGGISGIKPMQNSLHFIVTSPLGLTRCVFTS